MREAMVTRTFKTINVVCLGMNKTDKVVSEYLVPVSDKNYSEKKLEKVVREAFINAHPYSTFIEIVETSTSEQLYGMPEATFLLTAKPIERKKATN